MHLINWQTFLSILLFVLPALSYGRNPPGNNAILLSKVQTLTLRGNRLTTSRRVNPIPQLKCTGPSKRICNLYPIDVMRCTNAGYDYDEEDVQWTCTASLPSEFKLGSTDVVCEGYRNSDDKWILKGSCGVEYRLLLTELGERKFGRVREETGPRGLLNNNGNGMALVGDIIFFGIVGVIFLVILVAICSGSRGNRRAHAPGPGFGGGGGGGGGPYPGPPPPYSSYPPESSSFASAPGGQGWRPGFWTGAATGAAAGYHVGRQSRRDSFPNRRSTGMWNDAADAGEGSSRSRSPQLSSPTTSTGFGSTRRR
ncbi:hypothetical protein BDV26DRAFT_286597 [Aspergillus bertholletiae]|uniref:Store-operated calcium entry-associated regulatory factor n=1 Tax=Aspergillus bertholletiae TaxID=1226010 RepID=A0A5N7AP74_9EURO|nr:hypothetical protein BDV26DRAFT_286597 [Aspergillus bertholletiae]